MCKSLDPGGVDWVASHPSLEQPTKKIKYLEKQMEIRWSPKIIEIHGMQKPSDANQPPSFLNHHA